MNAKMITMALPATQSASFKQAVVDGAVHITAAIVKALPLMASGKVSEIGGECQITAPDGRRFTVSVWLRDAAEAPVPLAERMSEGNG